VSLTKNTFNSSVLYTDATSFADIDVYRDKLPIEFDQNNHVIKYYTIERSFEDYTLYVVTDNCKKEIITLKNSQIIGSACYSDYHKSVFQLMELNGIFLIEIKNNDSSSIVRLDDVSLFNVKRISAVPDQNRLIVISNSNIVWIDPSTGYIIHNIYYEYENPLNGNIHEPILDEFIDICCTKQYLIVISKCFKSFGTITHYVIYYDINTYKCLSRQEIDIQDTFTIGYIPQYNMGILISLNPDQLFFLYDEPPISKNKVHKLMCRYTKLNIDLAEIITDFTHGLLF
jgi:hypothetical protein